jgi:hypothetical protein
VNVLVKMLTHQVTIKDVVNELEEEFVEEKQSPGADLACEYEQRYGG